MNTAVAWRRPDAYPILRAVKSDAVEDLHATLAGWRLWQESGNLSERTIKERAGTITKLLAFTGCGPLELQPRHIIAYLTRPGLNNTSKATYHATIRAYCKFLLLSGQREDDPSIGTPKPKRAKTVPRPVEIEQLRATIELVASRRAHNRRAMMMLLLAAYAGLRIHEIAKVRGEDFDLDAGLLYVVGKGSKNAALPIHPYILEKIGDFPRQGYWFPSYTNRGEPVCPHAVANTITRNMARAGFKVTAHQLRHFFGTALVRGGVDLRTTQELMRHENLSTTAIYIQVTDEQRRKAINGLPALDTLIALN